MSDRHRGLELLRPDFKVALVGLLEQLKDMQIPLAVFESVRSPGRQNELYMRGRDPGALDYGRTVTRAKAYESAHQYGLGADLVFRLASGVWTWDEPEAGMWDAYRRLAKARGLECLSFERPHVQIEGFDFRRLRPGPIAELAWNAWLGQPDAGRTA